MYSKSTILVIVTIRVKKVVRNEHLEPPCGVDGNYFVKGKLFATYTCLRFQRQLWTKYELQMQ